MNIAHPPQHPRAVHRPRLHQRFRDGLQPGKEEDEVIGHLLPRAGDDHHRHGLIAAGNRIPHAGENVVYVKHDPGTGIEDKPKSEADGRGRDGIGPDHPDLVGFEAAQLAVNEHRKRQRHANCQSGRPDGIDHRDPDRVPIKIIRQNFLEIIKAHPGVAAAPGLL